MVFSQHKYHVLACRIVFRVVRKGTGCALLMLLAASMARAENLVALAANHPDAAADLAATGNTAPPYQALQMEIYLKPRNQAQLQQLLQEQQDPKSPNYHKWLTPDEYAQEFGPTAADVSQVSNWLTSQGFTVTSASASQRRVTFTGIVATAQAAFNVSIAASSNGKKFGNTEDPQVPASLAPKIGYVAGLDNLHGTLWNEFVDDPPFNNQSGDPSTTPFFGPNDIRSFNDETPLLNGGFDGTGQCVALSEGSDVDQASLGEFDTIFGLPAFTVGTNFIGVYPDGQPAAPGIDGGGSPYGEAMLDVEYAHGLAPGATIVLYAANAGTEVSDQVTPLVDTLQAAVSDTTHHCASVAVSWAQCGEPNSFFTNLDTIYQQGDAEGQSIFVATGDLGTAAPAPDSCAVPPSPPKPHIEENAGSPNVTAVGAAMFTPTYDTSTGDVTSTLADTKQSVWKFARISKKLPFLAAAGASTGGYSAIFSKPAYQDGVKGIKGNQRAVPDLVLSGGFLGGTATVSVKGNKIVITGKLGPSPNFWECFDSGLIQGNGAVDGYECETTGGTSIVPPQYAGIFAIVVQKSGQRQGLINTKLYAMAQANLKKPSAVGFIDITSGNNAILSVKGYSAAKGYDPASGWGTLDINQFVNSFIGFTP
jgi:subtilase family serine protease